MGGSFAFPFVVPRLRGLGFRRATNFFFLLESHVYSGKPVKTIDRYLLFRMGSILLQAMVALTLVYIFVDLFTHRMIDIRKFHVSSDVVVQYYLNLLRARAASARHSFCRRPLPVR